jgi:hypothetical protein
VPKRKLVSLFISLSLLILTLLAWSQRQGIFDWWRLRGYQPSAATIQLAADTTMKPGTKHLFYVYHPELDDRNTFSRHCPNESEKTIVLGCYVYHQGIYLFDVTDPRLAGIKEVTAAHETLHAAYDRLSANDRNKVNAMIQRAYSQVSDQRIRSTIDSYKQAGADTTNELHSILGTEVRNLPPDLEAYYARYFNDRKKIVSFSEQYEKVFSDRKNLADSYLQQLNQLEGQLKMMQNEISNMENNLRGQYQQLEQQRRTTNDAAGFNSQVAAYNAQVTAYQDKVNGYNALVKEHNSLLEKYNAVALEENELIKAIDSHTATAQTQ